MRHCKNQTGEGTYCRQAFAVASRLASGAIRSRTLSMTSNVKWPSSCTLLPYNGLEHVREEAQSGSHAVH